MKTAEDVRKYFRPEFVLRPFVGGLMDGEIHRISEAVKKYEIAGYDDGLYVLGDDEKFHWEGAL
jgi:hypothetical protein